LAEKLRGWGTPFFVCSEWRWVLIIDMHEAVKLSKSSGVSGLEALESSGHWAALEELGQRIMMKVAHS
jgi:hypothetical protein